MLTLNCPSCGAEVNFRSKSSVFAVCTFCKSSLVRHDTNLEAIGKIGDLQDDITPLQVGTVGNFEGKAFEILGRLKISYSDGFWNEWYCLFSDGKEAWLAEAQGFYAVCFPVTNIKPPSRGNLKAGQEVVVGSAGSLEIEDMRSVTCVYSEGELPIMAAQGRKAYSVDLADADGQMGTIEYADKETRVYTGRYQEFDDFKFKNLRRIDGW